MDELPESMQAVEWALAGCLAQQYSPSALAKILDEDLPAAQDSRPPEQTAHFPHFERIVRQAVEVHRRGFGAPPT